MSLINEALKRAERDKHDNTPPGGGQDAMRPVQTARTRGRSPTVKIVILLVFIALTAGTWVLLDGIRSRSPGKAAAASASPASAAPHQEGRIVPDSEQTEAQPAQVKQKDLHEDKQSAADLVIAKSIAESKYYRAPPLAERATDPPQGNAVPLPGLMNLAKAVLPSPAQGPAHPSDRPVHVSRRSPNKPAAPVAKRRPVRFNPRDYKLSAIMRGPEGATAIINGRFIQVGGVINQAKVVKINRHTAELEIDEQRFTIQM